MDFTFLRKAWFDWAVFYIHSIRPLHFPVVLSCHATHHTAWPSPCPQLFVLFMQLLRLSDPFGFNLFNSIHSISFISSFLDTTLKHSNHWTRSNKIMNASSIEHLVVFGVHVMVVCYNYVVLVWRWCLHRVVGKWSIIRPFRLAMVAFTHHCVGIIYSIH